MIPIPPKVAAWAASLTGKLVLWGIAAALVAFAAFRVYHWIHEDGVLQERAVWVAAQEEADRVEARRVAAQEKAASEARAAGLAKGQAQRAAAVLAAGKTNEEIQRAYDKNPAAAVSCTPDGRPAPVPASVRASIDKAKRAAETAGR